MRLKYASSCSLVLVLALCPSFVHAQRYGFGLVKKTVTLERRLLPDVRLGQESVAIAFPRGAGGLDANLFSSDLETLVAQNSGGLRLVSQKPDYELRCYTTAYQPAQIPRRRKPHPSSWAKQESRQRNGRLTETLSLTPDSPVSPTERSPSRLASLFPSTRVVEE